VRVRFLGTGTSFGVPVIGCKCAVCRSDDPRDQRTRHSLIIESDGTRLLVDTPPELRLQLVKEDIDSVDAVFLSHEHADHTHGLDDLRIFSGGGREPLPLYVAQEFEKELKQRFNYIWGKGRQTQPGSVVPDLDMITFVDGEPISPAGFEVIPIAFPHGVYRSYGFRAGALGVIIDGKSVTPDAAKLFSGIEVLIINALWFGDPHPGHFSIEEAVKVGRWLGANRTYLTHIAHRATHAEIEAGVPSGVTPAYDGLVIDL
jgi:phosphoribosyl 1,2-cyclic phosphate phosphodiesterase